MMNRKRYSGLAQSIIRTFSVVSLISGCGRKESAQSELMQIENPVMIRDAVGRPSLVSSQAIENTATASPRKHLRGVEALTSDGWKKGFVKASLLPKEWDDDFSAEYVIILPAEEVEDDISHMSVNPSVAQNALFIHFLPYEGKRYFVIEVRESQITTNKPKAPAYAIPSSNGPTSYVSKKHIRDLIAQRIEEYSAQQSR